MFCNIKLQSEFFVLWFTFANRKLLMDWIHRIGRSNLPLSASTVATKTCSRDFINTEGQKLMKVQVSLECLPIHPAGTVPVQRRQRNKRHTTNV